MWTVNQKDATKKLVPDESKIRLPRSEPVFVVVTACDDDHLSDACVSCDGLGVCVVTPFQILRLQPAGCLLLSRYIVTTEHFMCGIF
jgi:hypothetical protein